MSTAATPDASIFLSIKDPNLQNGVYMAIRSIGIRNVYRCNNHREIFQLFNNNKSSLIIVDFTFHSSYIDESVETIFASFPDTPIIALISVKDIIIARQRLNKKVLILEKPFQTSQLVELILSLFQKKVA